MVGLCPEVVVLAFSSPEASDGVRWPLAIRVLSIALFLLTSS